MGGRGAGGDGHRPGPWEAFVQGRAEGHRLRVQTPQAGAGGGRGHAGTSCRPRLWWRLLPGPRRAGCPSGTAVTLGSVLDSLTSGLCGLGQDRHRANIPERRAARPTAPRRPDHAEWPLSRPRAPQGWQQHWPLGRLRWGVGSTEPRDLMTQAGAAGTGPGGPSLEGVVGAAGRGRSQGQVKGRPFLLLPWDPRPGLGSWGTPFPAPVRACAGSGPCRRVSTRARSPSRQLWPSTHLPQPPRPPGAAPPRSRRRPEWSQGPGGRRRPRGGTSSPNSLRLEAGSARSVCRADGHCEPSRAQPRPAGAAVEV